MKEELLLLLRSTYTRDSLNGDLELIHDESIIVTSLFRGGHRGPGSPSRDGDGDKKSWGQGRGQKLYEIWDGDRDVDRIFENGDRPGDTNF